MCLTPHRSFHPSKKEKIRTRYGTYNNRLEVLTLTRPIIVIKGLKPLSYYDNNTGKYSIRSYYDNNTGKYSIRLVSPFQATQYEFGRVMTAPNMANRIDHYGVIDCGIHALKNLSAFRSYFGRNEVRAASLEDRSKFKYDAYDRYAFPAVVPAGARIWFGYGGTVAVSELTVYEDMRSIRELYGGISPATSCKQSVGML